MWRNRLFYLLGCWIGILSALELLPIGIALFSGEVQAFQAFLSAAIITGLLGGSLFLGFRSSVKLRTPKLTLLLPVSGAFSLAVTAGLPFFFLQTDRGIITAIYEGMSLITTNGSSAYEHAFYNSFAVLFWRALVAWIGGYVAICITLSFLTAMNIGGLQLHQSPLPFGESQAGYARLRATAKALYPVYLMATGACALFLWVELSFFNAVVLAMATISTTGLFDSLAHLSVGIWTEAILVVFMLFSILNWDMHYARMTKRKLYVGRDAEFNSTLIIVAVLTAVIFVIAEQADVKALWHGFFASVSALSTTGLMPVGFMEDNSGYLAVGIALMLAASVGGCIVSTSGGLKQLRLMVIFRAGRAEVNRLAHPHGVSTVSINRVSAQQQDIEAVWLLLGSFVLALATGSLLLAILGVHFQDALAMSFTALTLSGPLISVTDPLFGGFAALRDADYAILTFLMLVGRVEASLMLALFAKSLWRG
ncbi:MAG: hypothetical protein COB37_01395 [Kordiimonadales bacterium]|nr:MAG: hypothetical protein COB37_01395 [Kordiimonadales bacterium]